MMPVGVSSPHVTVVAVTKQPLAVEVLVVTQEAASVAETGQEIQILVTVLVAVQLPVVVVLVELPSTHPVIVAHVDKTCEPVVVATVPEVDTPEDTGSQHPFASVNVMLQGLTVRCLCCTDLRSLGLAVLWLRREGRKMIRPNGDSRPWWQGTFNAESEMEFGRDGDWWWRAWWSNTIG
jgi:hypothetical protein